MTANRNSVAAILAIGTLIGFLAILAFLAVGTVPTGNKDYFNMALVALIGFVGTAFGYYLGSSVGSSRKTEILAGDDDHVPAYIPTGAALQSRLGGSEEGFITLRLSLAMALFFGTIAFASLFSLTGCATTGTGGKQATPQSVAAKMILSARQGVITAATTADALCSQGRLSQPQCDQVAEIYRQAQAAYITTADAMMLAIQVDNSASWQTYSTQEERFLRIFRDIDTLSKTFGGAK